MKKYRKIPLSKGGFALVDSEDFELVGSLRWHLHTSGYAVNDKRIWLGNGKSRVERRWMHRMIMNTPKDTQTDHINHDKLDNRRSNLRLCSQSENSANASLRKDSTSGYKGVTWLKRTNMWQVRIGVKMRRICIGHFREKEEAIQAYRAAAQKYHGEFGT